jgi:hypothetical protein
METRKCIDCGTEFEPVAQYQLYCDSFCAMRSSGRVPACGDMLCNHFSHSEDAGNV